MRPTVQGSEGRLPSDGQTVAGAGGHDEVRTNTGASGSGKTLAGGRCVEGRKCKELCPGEEAEEGGAEDREEARADEDEAMRGSDQEVAEESHQARPAHDAGSPTKAENERHAFAHMLYRA